MGTIIGTTLINNVATALKDTNNVRWTRTELLAWLNEAQRQLVLYQPVANPYTTAVQMVVGARQSLPADGYLLLDIYRNMGATPGTTPGNAVRIISRKLLDAFQPGWDAAANNAAVIQNYMYSIKDRLAYYVYPPSDGTGFIEICYAQIPAPLSAETSAIVVPDIFDAALENYMLYRACLKDAEFAPGMGLANNYWTAFIGAVQGEKQGVQTEAPVQGLNGQQPFNPGATS